MSREATHAGSWYAAKPDTLGRQLDEWLDAVPGQIDGVNLPVPGARVIIAPHAGYSYSGPPAAWAYKSLDLSKAKRVFLLGPSHHVHLSGCALSKCTSYDTPFGKLALDKATIDELASTGEFEMMSRSTDEDEHSLEMHLPYIHRILSGSFKDTPFPPLTPILVGATTPSVERSYGALLAPYLRDPTSVFIISSDFCHWGLRFGYTYYLPELPKGTVSKPGVKLSSNAKTPTSPKIHESIAALDSLAMRAIETRQHDELVANLKDTGNTVCGRHPIGVVMAAIETLEMEEGSRQGRFKFIRYERSSDAVKVGDSSVSYASAYAILS